MIRGVAGQLHVYLTSERDGSEKSTYFQGIDRAFGVRYIRGRVDAVERGIQSGVREDTLCGMQNWKKKNISWWTLNNQGQIWG
jgi:hypothetical protein